MPRPHSIWFRHAILALCAALYATPAPHAVAYTHPGIPLTADDLGAVKARLGTEPWKSAYEALLADGHASLDYTMQGPFDHVARNEGGTGVHIHLTEWEQDMQAAYYLALRWYFTGDSAYAQKSHDILMAWAGTLTSFTGYEAAFEVGGTAQRFVTGADILRGTWPGWTQADTTTLQNHFIAVYWPTLSIPSPVLSANQGGFQMMGAVAIAVFCDDETRLNQALASLTADPDSGFRDTLANGEVGDTGRDQGHSYNQVWQLAWSAEILWKQGIDVFSLYDDRVLAVSEYYCRYNVPGGAPPFVPLAAPFTNPIYQNIGGAPRSSTQNRLVFNIVHGAYVVRKSLSAPWTTLYRNDTSETPDSFVYRKVADTSTAVPYVPTTPAVASVSGGLTSANLNGATPTGSTTYSNGTWTLASGYGGNDPWNDAGNDSVRFAYRQVTGDFTLVAQVNSVANVGSVNAKAGLMMRDSLGTASNRCWVAITANSTYERAVIGYTNIPYGSNNARMSVPIAIQAPYWVKMERVGNRMQTFTSPNGGDWSPACVAELAYMPSTVYVGLFGASMITGSASTATFSHVFMTGGDGRAPITAPAAPFSVLAGPANGRAALRWNESFGATGYHVKRSTTSGGPYTTVATVPATATSYTDTGLTNETPYYYVVSAVNASGESADTPEDAVTPVLDGENVATRGTSSASSNTGTGGEASARAFDSTPGTKWFNGNSGNTGWIQYDLGVGVAYVVRRYAITSASDTPERDPKDWELQGSEDGTNWVTLDSRSGRSFTYRSQTLYFPVSSPGTHRFYRLDVTANNGDATGVQLAELSLLAAPADLPPLSAPQDLTATATSAHRIDLAWSAVTDATSYRVYRATDVNGPYIAVDPEATGTTFADLGLTSGKRYFYYVVAKSAAGQSVASHTASALPVGLVIGINFIGGSSSNGTPSALAPGEVAGVAPAVAWNNASGASGTLASLVTNAASTTGAYVTWSANNTWSTAISDEGGDTRMMKGYLDTSSTSTTTVIVSRLPSSFTAGGYTVCVFCDGDNGSNSKTAQYTLAGTTHGATDDASSSFSGTFTEANDASGNYVVFDNQKSGSFTLSAVGDQSQSGPRAPVNGLQILAIAAASLLTAPAGLGATAVSGSRIDLAWSPDADAMTYTIRRATTPEGPYEVVASGLSAATYSDTGLSLATAYYYTVTASNAAGESAASASASATTFSARETWRLSYFGDTVATGTAADDADPDGDGLSNALEYVFGSSPLDAGDAAAPAVTESDGALTLTFHRVPDTSLGLAVESSDDLATWTIIASLPKGATFWSGTAFIAEVEAGDEFTVSVTDASSTSLAHRFLRLRVEF